MKTYSLPVALIAVLATALTLSACGKTKRVDQTASPATVSTATSSFTFTTTTTSTSTSTSTSGTAPLSFEFTRLGSQTVVTSQFNTDNVLKVKFRVTPEQGNTIWKASELNVTLAFNGTEVTPTYTNNNYVYGQIGETSNVIDLSSYLTPGVPVQITIKNPKNDFYCTYWGGYYFDLSAPYIPGYAPVSQYVNPQYNAYPGCRKAVFSTHNWSGVLLVQTSSTQAI